MSAPNPIVGLWLGIFLEITFVFSYGIPSKWEGQERPVFPLTFSVGWFWFCFFLVDQLSILCLEYLCFLSGDVSHLYLSPGIPRIDPLSIEFRSTF